MHRQQVELLLTDDLLLHGHWGKEDALAQCTSFNTLDNWGHKTPTQSKRKRTTGRKRLNLKGHVLEHTQYTQLHMYEYIIRTHISRHAHTIDITHTHTHTHTHMYIYSDTHTNCVLLKNLGR